MWWTGMPDQHTSLLVLLAQPQRFKEVWLCIDVCQEREVAACVLHCEDLYCQPCCGCCLLPVHGAVLCGWWAAQLA